jgi:hypothetical protein
MNKDQCAIDKTAYRLAKEFLPGLGIDGVTTALVEKYLNPLTLPPRPESKEGLYQRILESAQNASMKAGVIGRAIGGVQRLSVVLDDFNPKAVIDRYSGRCDLLLDTIVERVKPRGKVRRSPLSIWPKYCQTILSAAAFMEQFSSPSDFYEWVDFFDRDDRARASLPMLLSREITGLGFALSCDFLKELGYVNFPKPDVHLRDIFTALGLCQHNPEDYHLFKAVIRLASHADVTAYNADKVFWLIGSGYFNLDPDIGRNGRIGSKKKEFIEHARSRLDSIRVD